jgi:hypothetical protein
VSRRQRGNGGVERRLSLCHLIGLFSALWTLSRLLDVASGEG